MLLRELTMYHSIHKLTIFNPNWYVAISPAMFPCLRGTPACMSAQTGDSAYAKITSEISVNNESNYLLYEFMVLRIAIA